MDTHFCVLKIHFIGRHFVKKSTVITGTTHIFRVVFLFYFPTTKRSDCVAAAIANIEPDKRNFKCLTHRFCLAKRSTSKQKKSCMLKQSKCINNIFPRFGFPFSLQRTKQYCYTHKPTPLHKNDCHLPPPPTFLGKNSTHF